MSTTIGFDELRDATGRDLGHSDWMIVDQPRIDTFADAIDDHQWIHVDPARAAPLPSGSRVRTHAVITGVTEVAGGLQVAARVTAEAEGVERPVCVADVQIRFLR